MEFDLESGGGDGAMAFSDKTVRRGFIRKVYCIISVQLLITFGTIALFMNSYGIRNTLLSSEALFWTIFGICAVSTFVIIIAMACVRTLRVSFPLNFILLGLFTAAESVMLGQAMLFYPHDVVLIAAGITAFVVIGLTIFAFQTKIDFTMCGGILCATLLVFIIFGLAMAFLPMLGVNVEILELVYSAIGVLIFSIYLVYDTQMMIGGSHKYSVSPEEYIFAAIAIYLDIINLFLHILKLVAAAKKN